MAAKFFEVIVELTANTGVYRDFHDRAFVVAHLRHQCTDTAFPLLLRNGPRHEVELLHAVFLKQWLAHQSLRV